MIGKNFVPNGITVAEWFGEEAVYSNLLETEIQIGQDTYYVSKMGIQRKISADNCGHLWEVEGEQEASCSEKGKAFYQCSLCGEEKVVLYHHLVILTRTRIRFVTGAENQWTAAYLPFIGR